VTWVDLLSLIFINKFLHQASMRLACYCKFWVVIKITLCEVNRAVSSTKIRLIITMYQECVRYQWYRYYKVRVLDHVMLSSTNDKLNGISKVRLMFGVDRLR